MGYSKVWKAFCVERCLTYCYQCMTAFTCHESGFGWWILNPLTFTFQIEVAISCSQENIALLNSDPATLSYGKKALSYCVELFTKEVVSSFVCPVRPESLLLYVICWWNLSEGLIWKKIPFPQCYRFLVTDRYIILASDGMFFNRGDSVSTYKR